MADIHKIDQNQYCTLKAMMEDINSIELAVEILKNTDREDTETNYYVHCLGDMYVEGSIFYNPNVKTIWQAKLRKNKL